MGEAAARNLPKISTKDLSASSQAGICRSPPRSWSGVGSIPGSPKLEFGTGRGDREYQVSYFNRKLAVRSLIRHLFSSALFSGAPANVDQPGLGKPLDSRNTGCVPPIVVPNFPPNPIWYPLCPGAKKPLFSSRRGYIAMGSHPVDPLLRSMLGLRTLRDVS